MALRYAGLCPSPLSLLSYRLATASSNPHRPRLVTAAFAVCR